MTSFKAIAGPAKRSVNEAGSEMRKHFLPKPQNFRLHGGRILRENGWIHASFFDPQRMRSKTGFVKPNGEGWRRARPLLSCITRPDSSRRLACSNWELLDGRGTPISARAAVASSSLGFSGTCYGSIIQQGHQ